MIKNLLVLLLIVCSLSLSAQSAISGHINLEDVANLEGNVYLTKMDGSETAVASASIKKDGSFSFRKKHISDKNTMYRIYVNRVEKAIRDTIVDGKSFILSNKDSIRFESGTNPFSGFSNSNRADAEWRKLEAFQENLALQERNVEDTISEAYATKLRSYAKDSLKILMVKLIGVQQLENKGLLDTDIAKNPKYYLALLEELKASDLAKSEYFFLQKKLAYLTQDVVEAKYQWSKGMNILLGIAVMGLLFFVIRLKRKIPAVEVDLSRREQNIQSLILQGKTNKEIANELFISLSTVKTHITNIYGKLQVSSRQELLQKMQNS